MLDEGKILTFFAIALLAAARRRNQREALNTWSFLRGIDQHTVGGLLFSQRRGL
jgi:hypothetical protein